MQTSVYKFIQKSYSFSREDLYRFIHRTSLSCKHLYINLYKRVIRSLVKTCIDLSIETKSYSLSRKDLHIITLSREDLYRFIHRTSLSRKHLYRFIHRDAELLFCAKTCINLFIGLVSHANTCIDLSIET